MIWLSCNCIFFINSTATSDIYTLSLHNSLPIFGSHEIVATASRSQIGRALESLGHGSGTEIHLVLSVRDLVRQIPAEWQENIKHRATLSYAAFLDQIRDPERKIGRAHV